MNMNEVIANRGLELMGRPCGEYAFLHPNDDVNRGQSSNDTFPTAMHIAAVQVIHDRLLPAVRSLRDVPTGRTLKAAPSMAAAFGATYPQQDLAVAPGGAVVLSANTGCLIPMYSGDPIRRAEELIYTSEDLRAITDEWERIWFLDQPSHMTLYRTHGGIL